MWDYDQRWRWGQIDGGRNTSRLRPLLERNPNDSPILGHVGDKDQDWDVMFGSPCMDVS